jgi:hypothetical protein
MNGMSAKSPGKVEPNAHGWKEPLLKSGLPLEHEVARILNQNGLSVPGEYKYLRAQQGGGSIEHSVDIHASMTLNDPDTQQLCDLHANTCLTTANG